MEPKERLPGAVAPQPPQPERGAALRALPGAPEPGRLSEAANSRRQPGGGRTEGAEPRARSQAPPVPLATGAAPGPSARACRLPQDPRPAHRPAGITWPGPPAAPDTGSGRKPETGLRCLRQPPPAAGRGDPPTRIAEGQVAAALPGRRRATLRPVAEHAPPRLQGPGLGAAGGGNRPARS